MTNMNDYLFHRPTTLDEAFEARRRDPDARWLAGGTEILVQIRKGRRECPTALISLRNVDELRGIEGGERLRIGAATSLTAVAEDAFVAARFPALVQSIVALGSRQIRNVATLGGNLCNASPCADTAPPLLVYGARIELRGPDGSRELALDEFFQGPGSTQLRDGEILSAVLLETPPPGSRAIFLRKGRVAMDIAMASVALYIEGTGARIDTVRAAAGAVAPIPLRLRAVEALLTGSKPDADLLRRAQEATMAEISPISDLRAGESYRRKLTGVFLRRAVEALMPAEVSA